MVYLILSEYGAYLGKEKERFKISFGGSSKPIAHVPANRVEGIIIDSKATISSGAFQLISKYGISVIWNDYQDDGMILLPYNAHGTVEVRKEQYASLKDSRGAYLAIKITFAAIQNKLNLLSRLIRNKIVDRALIIDHREKITDILDEFLSEDTMEMNLDSSLRQTLMNYEAKCAKNYYNALRNLLNEFGWSFNKRSRRPSLDPFNSLLNYSYAVLKGQLTQRIAITGLDVFAGYLHVDRSGRESLVLDIIEEFRQVAVDEVLIKLVVNHKLNEDMFERKDEEVIITKEIKEVLLSALLKQFTNKYDNRKLDKWFIYQSRMMSNFLRSHSSEYIPFLLKVKNKW